MQLVALLVVALGSAVLAVPVGEPDLPEDTSVALSRLLAEHPDAQPQLIGKRGLDLPEDTSVGLSRTLAAHPDAEPQRVSRRGSAALAEEPKKLVKRGYAVEANDLNGACKAVTVIFARGTLEWGNIGLLAGPPFFDALGVEIGFDNMAVQGVPYA